MAAFSTTWVIAAPADAPEVADSFAEETDTYPMLWLKLIGEIEIMTLAEVLAATYEPKLLFPEDGDGEIFVIHVTPGFVRALSDVGDVATTALKWKESAPEEMTNWPDTDLQKTLGNMREFAGRALNEGRSILCVMGVD